jgi:branched-chain amino acid transport system permease protein
VVFGMYLAYTFHYSLHLSIYTAIPFAALAAIPVGVILYWICFRGTENSTAAHSQLIIAVGLTIVLQTLAQQIYGPTPKTSPSIRSLHISDISIPSAELIAFCAAIVLTVALQLLLAKTQLGRALRAIVVDREMARLIGIRSNLVFPLAFAGSTALAAVAGVVLYGFYPVSPVAGNTFLLIAFVCVILGGAGDTMGAFLAGLLVGVTESVTATYWHGDLQDVPAYVLFILVLMVRPAGLLGRGVEVQQ